MPRACFKLRRRKICGGNVKSARRRGGEAASIGGPPGPHALLCGFAQIPRLRRRIHLPRSPHQDRPEQDRSSIVQTSAGAISLPVLDMPGWLDAYMLPKATAVVMALKTTALVRLDCRKAVFPARHAMM